MYSTKRPTNTAAEEILNKYFPVHDYGFVALKDYMGTDQCIEESARVSYSYGTRKVGETKGLVRSLMRRGHTSPFEMFEVKFHCAMPIFVARQWIRVRTASVNEMSGRYSLMPMLFYTPEKEQVLAQSTLDKQGRSGELQNTLVSHWIDDLKNQRNGTVGTYHWATESDFARELARIDLPLSTYTQWYWKIDGNNLLKTLSLRCDTHAQWETRQYFNTIAGIAKKLLPIAFEAWEDYQFYAKKFSRQEMQLLRNVISNADDGLIASNGLTSEQLSSTLNKTEKMEFLAKFKEQEIVNFDLDLSKAKEPAYFEELYRKSAEE